MSEDLSEPVGTPIDPQPAIRRYKLISQANVENFDMIGRYGWPIQNGLMC
jgi:hypothetical protein